jgi:hypothetical protein
LGCWDGDRDGEAKREGGRKRGVQEWSFGRSSESKYRYRWRMCELRIAKMVGIVFMDGGWMGSCGRVCNEVEMREVCRLEICCNL